MTQGHGQPALDGDGGQVQRLDPAAGEGVGFGIEGVQCAVGIDGCGLGGGLPGMQQRRVVGDGQVYSVWLYAESGGDVGCPVGGPAGGHLVGWLAGNVVANPVVTPMIVVMTRFPDWWTNSSLAEPRG